MAKDVAQQPEEKNIVDKWWDAFLEMFRNDEGDHDRRLLKPTSQAPALRPDSSDDADEEDGYDASRICVANSTDIFHAIDSKSVTWMGKERKIVYSQRLVTGKIAKEDFSTTSKVQMHISQFEFLAVDKDNAPIVAGFEMRGLLGLSTSQHPTQTFTSTLESDVRGTLFMDKLFK